MILGEPKQVVERQRESFCSLQFFSFILESSKKIVLGAKIYFLASVFFVQKRQIFIFFFNVFDFLIVFFIVFSQ